MKPFTKFPKHIIFGILVVVSIASCLVLYPSDKPSVSSPVLATQPMPVLVNPGTIKKSTLIPITQSAAPPAQIPTNTPIPTRISITNLPSLIIPTITFEPTWTPLPTLKSSEASKFVMKLITENAGCRLPCWWGLTSGKTKWFEAEHFLYSFIKSMDTVGPSTVIENGTYHIYNTYYLGYQVPYSANGGGANISVTDNIIQIIDVGPELTKYLFNLHQLLTDYGKPDEVYIRTFSNGPSSAIPFYLVVFYQSQHILALYETNLIKRLDILQGCFEQTAPQLTVWAETEVVTEKRIQDWTMGIDPSSSLKPLEEATKINIEEFFQSFREENNKECIETPANLW